MDPESPRLQDLLRDLWNRIQDLLWMATAPVRGTSAAGAWLRLALLGVGMVVFYFGMQALIGKLPETFKALGDFFRNSFELAKVLSHLVLPAPEPGAIAELPKAPAIPLGVRLQLLLRSWSQDDVQDFLVFFLIPIIWALGRAVNVFEDTYRLNSFRAVAESLLAAYIPLFRRSLAVRAGNMVMNEHPIHPRRVGGPLRMAVDEDSLAVLEPVRGTPRLYTATPGRVEVDAFERLHRILDLRPNRMALNMALHTRDGIAVRLQQAHFGYRMRTTDQGVDLQAAQTMVYRHWLGKSWENPITRSQDARRLVRRELAQFISDHKDLADLVADAATLPAPAANPVRGQVLREFVDYFNSRPEQVFQLTWEEDGAWTPPDAVFEPAHANARQTGVQDRALRLQLAQMIPGNLRKEEIQSMVQGVLDLAATQEQANLPLPERVTQLLARYAALLGVPPP